MMRFRTMAAATVGLAAAAGLWRTLPAQMTEPARQAAVDPAGMPSLTGSASCSARGCHGGIAAKEGSTCGCNEYTLWIGRDPHGNAYRVLGNDLSKDIVARLRKGEPERYSRPAYEEPVCLACHVHPQIARRVEGAGIDGFVRTEMGFGVGCEACHGAASAWLAAHTRPDWKTTDRRVKDHLGMTPIEDPVGRARMCVGCHVGAPEDAANHLRDVHHDLIAAGHPRMQFEASAFLANLPPHWRTDTEERRQRSEGMTWAAGQLVAAEAALRLLEHRASVEERWPELAEYSCYACHHDLRSPSWRQRQDRQQAQAGNLRGKVGGLDWGAWYFTMPKLLADFDGPAKTDLGVRLEELKRTLTERVRPDQLKVRDQAQQARRVLADQLLRETFQAGQAKAWNRATSKNLLGTLAKMDLEKLGTDWENAEQLYLACQALNTDVGDAGLQEALSSVKGPQNGNGLLQLRAFGVQPRIDGPVFYRPEAFFGELRKALGQ